MRLSVVFVPFPAPGRGRGGRGGRRREDLDSSEVIQFDDSSLGLEDDSSPVSGSGGKTGRRGDSDARLSDGDDSPSSNEDGAANGKKEIPSQRRRLGSFRWFDKTHMFSKGVGVVTVVPASWKRPVLRS